MTRHRLFAAGFSFLLMAAIAAVLLTDCASLSERVHIECGALCRDPASLPARVLTAFNTYRSEIETGVAALGTGGPADTVWQRIWERLLPENYFFTRLDVVRDFSVLFCVRLTRFAAAACAALLFIAVSLIDGWTMRRVAFVEFAAPRPIAGGFALEGAGVMLLASVLVFAAPVPHAVAVSAVLLVLSGWSLRRWVREYHRFG